MMEKKKEVKAFNVYAECDCGGSYAQNEPFVVWNDNGTKGDLSDDTFDYSYICDSCEDIMISSILYPHQEFKEI